MVNFVIDNSHIRIVADTKILRIVDKLLSYEVQGAFFAQRATGNGWDGKVRLLSRDGVFPTGLLPIVIRQFKKDGVEYKFTDVRVVPNPSVKYRLDLPFDPRSYQQEAVAITDKRSRGVFLMGTGAGKTLTSALLIAKKQVPTLFICPDTGLKEQVAENFKAWFGEHMVATNVADPRAIVVSNIQSLVRADAKHFMRFGCLITDEFHHSGAKTYKLVSNSCRNAYYRYGFTGTFLRSDGTDMELHGVLSQIIYRKTTSELIQEGYLAAPEITVCQYRIPEIKCNYAEAYNRIIEDRRLNEIIAEFACNRIAEGKQVLVLVRRKAHGDLLANKIPKSIYLSGDDDSDYREENKKNFIDKKIPCLVATNIFGEGIDIPSIEVLINARFEKTEIQTKQGIGRALRKYPGKEKAEVIDFLIRGQKHLESHSLFRLKTYKSEPAFKITIKNIS